MSNSVRPHRRQLTRLPHPWDSPGKNTGVGCHFLLQRRKVKSESEVAQLCPTLSNPMDYRLPGSSIHGIFQAEVLEWGAIAFSKVHSSTYKIYSPQRPMIQHREPYPTLCNNVQNLRRASLVAQMVKNLPAMWEIWVQSLSQEDPLEK